MKTEIIHGDCLEVMKSYPDKYFDLVLTDPPYGIGLAEGTITTYGQSTINGKKYKGEWDKITPNKEIFDEIIRVGKKVIIFGGNFFTDKLPVNGHWIVWDKKGDIKFDNPFGDCELAWTNIERKSVKKYTVIQQGFISEEKNRFHPTQKPVSLFHAIIRDYTEDDALILDPFAGSCTTLIASEELGRTCVCIEKEEQYVEIGKNRLQNMTKSLF